MFELIRAGLNTYYIESPVKIGVYKLNDKDVCLIDTGNSSAVGRKAASIVELNGWTVRMIINTHSHADHCGGNAFLQKRYGCPAYSAPTEATYISYPLLEPAALYGGCPDGSLRGKSFMAEASDCRSIEDITMPAGLEYTYLNGHCMQMLGIKTDDGVWFMGDCVSRAEILEKYHITVMFDVAAELRTLDKIADLRGNLFIPSHTEALTSLAGIIAVNRAHINEICDLLCALCATPLTSDGILKAVFEHFNMRHTPQQHALIGYTVRSYLSYLVDTNRLTSQIEDGMLTYSAV